MPDTRNTTTGRVSTRDEAVSKLFYFPPQGTEHPLQTDKSACVKEQVIMIQETVRLPHSAIHSLDGRYHPFHPPIPPLRPKMCRKPYSPVSVLHFQFLVWGKRSYITCCRHESPPMTAQES